MSFFISQEKLDFKDNLLILPTLTIGLFFILERKKNPIL